MKNLNSNSFPEKILKKIEEVKKFHNQAQQQLIACEGALQVLQELLEAEENEVKEDETATD